MAELSVLWTFPPLTPALSPLRGEGDATDNASYSGACRRVRFPSPFRAWLRPRRIAPSLTMTLGACPLPSTGRGPG
jgi:hypothetical protein